MMNKVIGQCPVCDGDMHVTELECSSCGTKVSGRFRLEKFSRLNPDQMKFVEVFIKLRGNIKEVEQEMGISYPTVRKKLDEVIQALGFSPEESPEDTKAEERTEVLDALEKGEIEYEEAVEKLNKF